MAVLSNGHSLGTVGGGAVELRAQQDARTMLTDGPGAGPRIYDLGAGGQTGMVCGGVVTICFTRIDAGAWADLGKWAELLESRRSGVLLLGPDGCLRVLEQDEPAASDTDAAIYREDIGGEGVVYLFGAGHVGRALVPVLTGLEFPVVVYDERPEAVRPENFPTALAVVQGAFSGLSAHIRLTGGGLCRGDDAGPLCGFGGGAAGAGLGTIVCGLHGQPEEADVSPDGSGGGWIFSRTDRCGPSAHRPGDWGADPGRDCRQRGGRIDRPPGGTSGRRKRPLVRLNIRKQKQERSTTQCFAPYYI